MNEPKAGWYPVGDGTTRYWDGTAWTEHSRPSIGGDLTRSDPPTPALAQWVRNHKLATALAAVLVVGSCGALVNSGADSGTLRTAGESSSDIIAIDDEDQPTEPAQVEPVNEMSPVQQWSANADASSPALARTVARRLGVRPRAVSSSAALVRACVLISQDRPVTKRATAMTTAFDSDADFRTTMTAIATTIRATCPEFSQTHREQLGEHRAALRAAAEKRRRAEEREQRRLQQEEERRRLAEERERESQMYAYYANCDAARAAGAAPVYTGDPGYGRHLDRDGDGVGCE
ncbi:excalibur calcium-binding domain-containing protein [Nocardioides sp. R-C-SC26]|uniref:excalibur calcium-binding domain-containing protein n=1 Tax=Nocardioides sp. R-C-SC26 TaxID=2870414 RepID=UPI0027E04A6A|nr:excalibur calcium-binding domain-containing protein [Nocardioides sp. R-C-SC26]